MFAEPLFNLMLIIMLFFVGLVVIFIFILRSLELNARHQEELSRQIAISLTDLEGKVSELAFALRGTGLVTIEEAPSRLPAQETAGNNLAADLTSFFDKAPGVTYLEKAKRG